MPSGAQLTAAIWDPEVPPFTLSYLKVATPLPSPAQFRNPSACFLRCLLDTL